MDRANDVGMAKRPTAVPGVIKLRNTATLAFCSRPAINQKARACLKSVQKFGITIHSNPEIHCDNVGIEQRAVDLM